MTTSTVPRRPRPLRDRRTGRFVKTYTLTYADAHGTHTRTLTERGINTVGRIVNGRADRGEAWDIAVTDRRGTDVTVDFPVFA